MSCTHDPQRRGLMLQRPSPVFNTLFTHYSNGHIDFEMVGSDTPQVCTNAEMPGHRPPLRACICLNLKPHISFSV